VYEPSGHREIRTVHLPVNGLDFEVQTGGPEGGELVLLLHGFPETSHSWRHVLPKLARAGYRVVAPDGRGVSAGARPLDVAAYAIEHLVADVLGLADQFGAARFHLVGHDWGGAVAWQVAGRHPERLRTLTVVSTPHPAAFRRALNDPSADQATRSSYMQIFRSPAGEDMWLAKGREGLRELYQQAGLTGDAADPYVQVFSERAALTAFLNWYRAADPASPAGMGPITTPTLYVWSTEDPALGREAAEWTAEHVAGPYHFEVFAGVSHWIPEHAPERLGALLLAHLRGPDISSPRAGPDDSFTLVGPVGQTRN
jgi:pimeloyl-ACP methyl ester carboxylesterase